MSFFPRRVQDMTPMKRSVDSDDEPEPDETPNNKAERRSQYMLPKRVSELTPLKSDSDEELEYNDLNCARRLTNSDFLSPAGSDNDSPKKLPDTPTITFKPSKETVQNENNRNGLNSEAPAQSNQETELNVKLSNIDVTGRARLLNRPREENVLDVDRPAYRQIMPSNRFHQAFTDIVEPKNGLSIFKNIQPMVSRVQNPTSYNSSSNNMPQLPSYSNNPSSSIASNTPSTLSSKITPHISEAAMPPITSNEETPLKHAAMDFKTPSIEYTSHRPRALSRFPTTSSISKTDLNNEFQSKKIVFTTPSTVPCRPINLPKDASIDLSMNDTVSGVAPLSKSKMDTLDMYSSESSSPSPEKVLHINGHKFVIEKKIGAGGSSSVFLTHRADTKEQVAVKVVDLHGDAAVVTGYINETKLLAKLQGDESVIRLYEYAHIPDDHTLYMVMERGETDLHHVLQSHSGHLPLYSLMLYWHQMLNGVAYIHRNGVIHSDLKPANFLLVSGRLKLIDFGIASSIAVDSTSIIKFSQAGTFNYVSPEALIDTSTGNSPQGKANQPKIKISTKSDVWSLGCILYLFLYRKTPFAHIKNICTKAITITNPNTEVTYSELPDIYPAIYLKVLQRCLVYDPKKRASVQELLQSPYDLIAPHHQTVGHPP